MQTSRYGSVPPSLAVLMLLSNMSAHGIPSIEECTAVGVCAWQMMVHLQSVLSQFFQSTQHCYAVLDRAPELHGGKDVVHLISYRGAVIRRIMAVFMPLSSGSLTALHAREGLHRRNAKSYLGLFVNICFTLRKGCRYPCSTVHPYRPIAALSTVVQGMPLSFVSRDDVHYPNELTNGQTFLGLPINISSTLTRGMPLPMHRKNVCLGQRDNEQTDAVALLRTIWDGKQ